MEGSVCASCLCVTHGEQWCFSSKAWVKGGRVSGNEDACCEEKEKCAKRAQQI